MYFSLIESPLAGLCSSEERPSNSEILAKLSVKLEQKLSNFLIHLDPPPFPVDWPGPL